jgi:hypothetical protein
MNRSPSMLCLPLLLALGLAACQKEPTVVAVPVPVAVPGPAGSQGVAGDPGTQGPQGSQGEPGKTVVIMPPEPASGPASASER